MDNIFNRVMKGNFSKPGKRHLKDIQEAHRALSRQNQKRHSTFHIIVKTLDGQKGERVRCKKKVTGYIYRKKKTEQHLKHHKCQSRLLYPPKLSAIVEGERQTFHDTNRVLQRILKAIIWTEKRNNHSQETTERKQIMI